jgi:uncharacterized protein YegJ (DUF2314 family)
MGFLSHLFGRKKKSGDDFLSIVYLLRRPRSVEEPKLRAALASLVQSVMKEPRPPETLIKRMNEHCVGVMMMGQPFVVMSVDTPYTEDDPATITPDLRKQNLLEQHKAWLACDWMMPIENDEDRQVAYRTIGMVMAAVGMIVGKADIVAIFDKGTGRLVPFDDSAAQRLISEFPESVFDENPPMLSSEGLEDALAKAAEEAQRRLPEFVSALGQRKKGDVFAIKARFTEGETVEWMWVKVQQLTDTGFEGRLDNNPGEIQRLKAGDRVSVMLDEVVDWIIKDQAGMRGGFSVEVLKHRAETGE